MAPPVGYSNFIEVIRSGADYVDKTSMLDRILGSRARAFLFTRPRRFGKTMNISMMDAYLNIKYKGNDWFDGLAVSELRPEDPMKNAFPVIRLSLKDVRGGSYAEFVKMFRQFIRPVFSCFVYLLESDKLNFIDKKMLEETFSPSSGVDALSTSLKTLSTCLEKHHCSKVVILVDEYDFPLNSELESGERERIMDFMKTLFSSAFKDNDSLRLGVITGVTQITKEGLFSGLNNIVTDNILSTKFADSYGFTEEEVRHLLELNGASDKLSEVKVWYDGYSYGGVGLYNPWSVSNYIMYDCKPSRYWINTSKNIVLHQLLDRDGVFDDLSALTAGGHIRHVIRTDLTYEELFDREDTIYSVMATAGYLNAVPQTDGMYDLSIPNREILDEILELAANRRSSRAIVGCDRLMDCLKNSDCHGAEDAMTFLFTEFESFRILGRESDYHNFLYGLLVATARDYRPSVEGEAGSGYYDIRLESLDPSYPNVVIEVKKADADDTDAAVMSKAEKALEQIVSKGYVSGLSGRTDLYGVVFRSKKATAVSSYIGRD